MRTTVDLDPELHREALAMARNARSSLSQILNDALRKSLHPVPPVERDPVTGLGCLSIGRPVTSEEVARALNDD